MFLPPSSAHRYQPQRKPEHRRPDCSMALRSGMQGESLGDGSRQEARLPCSLLGPFLSWRCWSQPFLTLILKLRKLNPKGKKAFKSCDKFWALWKMVGGWGAGGRVPRALSPGTMCLQDHDSLAHSDGEGWASCFRASGPGQPCAQHVPRERLLLTALVLQSLSKKDKQEVALCHLT